MALSVLMLGLYFLRARLEMVEVEMPICKQASVKDRPRSAQISWMKRARGGGFRV
jgi:hypothetical protein